MKHPASITKFALAVRAAGYGFDRDIQAFINQRVSDGSFSTAGDIAKFQASATTFANTYSSQDGGFAVADDFVEDIYMRGEGALLPFCSVVPTTSGSLGIPTDATTPWQDSGIHAEWVQEGVALPEFIPDLSLQSFHLRKMSALVPLSEELIEDAPGLSVWLPQALQRAVTWEINTMIINGTGTGTFLGILNADCRIPVAAEGAQAASTIVAANIVKMMARCLDVAGARWIINPDALQQVMTLAQWDNATFTLGGLPVTLSEACPALGQPGDIILANLSGYRVAARGANLNQSSHLLFDRDLIAYKLTTRLDGAPILSSPVTVPNSTNTRSHFVVLAAR